MTTDEIGRGGAEGLTHDPRITRSRHARTDCTLSHEEDSG